MPTIRSPITGTVIAIQARIGEHVQAQHEVIIVESMKMEIGVPANIGGIVREVLVTEGAVVHEGDAVVVLE